MNALYLAVLININPSLNIWIFYNHQLRSIILTDEAIILFMIIINL